MRDSSHHGGRPADPDPPDELAGRLLRRAAGSVGVIDSGWAQRRFAYTTDWLEERFAVLGLLNARYGTVNNQAAGTSTALPVVHGSFAWKRSDTTPDESYTHAAVNESSPRTPSNEASTRMTTSEASTRATDNEGSPHIADEHTSTSGHEPRAAEIPAPSPNTGGALIVPVVQRKSATLSPNAALPHATSQRTAPQKSQPSTAQKSQPASAHESAPHAGMERPSPHEPPSAMAAEARRHQQSASNTAHNSSSTKQRVEVRETVVQPPATHEQTLRVDARAESPTTVMAEAEPNVVGGSSELNQLPPGPVETNHLPPSPEQHRAQSSQTASPLLLRETTSIVSRVAREAYAPLAMRSETFERGGRESESPVSGTGETQGVQSRANSLLPIAEEQTTTGHHTQLDAPLQQSRREPAQTATGHHAQHDQRTLYAEAAPTTTVEVAPHTAQAGAVRAHTPVSAPEVLQRPSHPSGARMIWRKSFGVTPLAADALRHAAQPGVQHSHSVQSVSSWPTVYRAESTTGYDSRSASGDGGSSAPAAPSQSEAGGIDLEQITEHISRVILRRVSVERERRGIGRWL